MSEIGKNPTPDTPDGSPQQGGPMPLGELMTLTLDELGRRQAVAGRLSQTYAANDRLIQSGHQDGRPATRAELDHAADELRKALEDYNQLHGLTQ